MGWNPTWNPGFLNNYSNLLFIRRKIAFKYDLMLTSTSTYLHIYTSTYSHPHDFLIYYFLHSQQYHFELTFAKNSGTVTSGDRGKKIGQ